ncbi:putative RNA-directed DNA polymerase from transposon BS [Trichonephila clavipes]|nr:putative RNA-directed DNA polymerase from transposon BS [Trichonephila clavipes]
MFTRTYGSNAAVPGKGLVLLNLNLNIDDIARNTRFLILSLLNDDMCKKSPFAIHKALIGIGTKPKSVKRLSSGHLLIETSSALQTKSLLLATSFLDSLLTISPHKSLNTSRGVISEPDLLSSSEAEILEGFSDQGVIKVRRITMKKDATIIHTKHLILTFNSPKLPPTIKAGYLNCKIRPYIPNPLRCFKCQSFHIVFYHSGKPLALRISSIKPTTQIESRLPEPISASAAAPDNSLSTSTSSLSTEACPAPTTSNKFAALQPSVPLSESATTLHPIAYFLIHLKSHRIKSGPTELTTDDEDMIMYDVQAEELEPDPEDKFAMKECFIKNPDKYIGALTPTRFRKSLS